MQLYTSRDLKLRKRKRFSRIVRMFTGRKIIYFSLVIAELLFLSSHHNFEKKNNRTIL